MSHGPARAPARLYQSPTPAPDARVLVLFCHPARQRSRVNAPLLEAARALPGITTHDLYEAYPDFGIDVEVEQALLSAHEVIVMQHPMYWYSTPALLKEWQDLVLTHGWAYGPGGTALRDKVLLSAVTTSGSATSYTAQGTHGESVRALLAPLAQTARLCHMRYAPPLITHEATRLDDAAITRAAARYARVLEALRDATLDLDAADAHGALDVTRATGARP